MTSRFPYVLIALALTALASTAALAEDKHAVPEAAAALTAEQIVQRANYVSYYQGADGRADVSMVTVDAKKNKRTRELTILRLDVPDEKAKADPKDADADKALRGDQKFYVYFHRPADVNKTTFLVHKHVDLKTDDDRWLYTPALDNITRIAGKDKRNRFVGTQFFYEDVSGRSIAEDTHELLKTTDKYYMLKHTPKDSKNVEFAYYKTYIHKSTFIVVQTAYYNADDEKYRTYQALKFQKVQGYPTITRARMTDHKTGGYSEATYKKVRYNVGLPDNVFTERYLRRAPRKYLAPDVK